MHTTVAHYASIPYPIPNTGRGVVFLGEEPKNYYWQRNKYAAPTGKWMPAEKLCPVCGMVKKFARANYSFCSRKCASLDMWAKRKAEA